VFTAVSSRRVGVPVLDECDRRPYVVVELGVDEKLAIGREHCAWPAISERRPSWLNLQKTYELRVAEIEAGMEIAKRVKPRKAAA
jgi:hypothetical protein